MIGGRFHPFCIGPLPAATSAIRQAQADRLELVTRALAPFILRVNGDVGCDNGWLRKCGANATLALAVLCKIIESLVIPCYNHLGIYFRSRNSPSSGRQKRESLPPPFRPMNRISSLLLLVFAVSSAIASDDEEFFEKQVRPILASKCLECHGDSNPESDLRLTSRELLLQGGKSGPAAAPGKVDQSLLITAILQQGKLKMPPEEKLREDEIATLRKWVEIGLPWPTAKSPPTKPRGEMVVTAADREHWSFRPLTTPAPPAVANSKWPQTSIDCFVLAKLEAAGLTPAPTADRRTLLRRVYYDLTGLPPTWQQVQAFSSDPAPDALERIADELLASPAYGERWGRHWLDVARFADTKDGVLMYGNDRIRPYAYTYRDYVIRALNADTPFDQFVREQLAADLVEPKVAPWRLAALGYLTLGRMYDNNIHDVIDDQIDTVSRGMLGLTVSCARCHDHKYDPIPTADYYSLYGVFAGCETPLELPLCEPADNTPGGAEFEKQATPKREELRKFLDEQYTTLLETARERCGDYLVRVATTKPDPIETAIFFLSLAPEDLRPPLVARWRRLVEQRSTPDDPVFGPWHDLLKISAEGASFAEQAAAVLKHWESQAEGTGPGQLNPLVRQAVGKAKIAGPADVATLYGDLLKRVYQESKAATGIASPPPGGEARAQLLEIIAGDDSPSYFPRSQTRRFMSRQQTDAFGGKVQELDRMAVQSPHAPPRAMALVDAAKPWEPVIFTRGNPAQRGKRVARQFLAIASPSERPAFISGSGRLELARAITAEQNPLSSRVIVNRVWMHHFIEPLVSSPSDFGARSTPPTHPELLDHLAWRFRAEGWSLKRLHRWMVQSSAYQQASSPSPETMQRAKQIDPDNRLLWKAHRHRLEFEALRDSLLAVSGRLSRRLGGRPADIASDPLNNLRTVYGLVDRQSLPSVFRAFDFANPDQSVERRSRTMTPQQALFALNSPFMIEQAQGLVSQPEIAGATEPTARLRALFQIIYAREPVAEELAAGLEFISAPPDAASKLSAWVQLAQALLSTNELVYLD